jgi:hypothetical protein
MLRILDIIKTIKRKIKLLTAVFQLGSFSSVLTLRLAQKFEKLSTLVCNSNRFEVIRDFYTLKNGGILFPVDGSIAERK